MKSLFSEQTLIPFLEQFDFSLVLRADAPQYTILVVSDQAEQLLGYQRAQLVNKSLTDGFSNAPIDPIGNAAFQQVLDTVIRDQRTHTLPTYEQPGNAGTGSSYLKKVLKPIVDTSQQVAYVLVTTIDITQQVLAQRQRLRGEIQAGFQQFHGYYLAAAGYFLALVRDDGIKNGWHFLMINGE